MVTKGMLLLHASHENMGDLLMLARTVEELRRRTPILPVIPSGYHRQSVQCLGRDCYQQINYHEQSLATRGRLKLANRFYHHVRPRHLIAARDIKASLPITKLLEIEKALDLCGFAFGDQWGAANATAHLNEYRRLACRGVDIIKMPASFGPFEDRETREATKEAMSLCSLIFARDLESLQHLQSIVPDSSKLAYCPDYSLSLSHFRESNPSPHKTLVVVPNFRMIDKSGFLDPSVDYTEVLRGVIEYATADLGLKVSLVLHDHNADMRYATEAGLLQDNRVEVIAMRDPIALKHFISKATAVLSSRYHGAANALSQGVPCIGTAWCHKYRHLFREYNQDQMLISRSCSDPLGQIKALLRSILEHKVGQADQDAITRIHHAVGKMWDLVASRVTAE